MTPKKPEWFELTDSAKASEGIQKVNRKLSIGTLVAAGAIILGGSVFATTQEEPSAVANTPVTSQSMAAAQTNTPATFNNANSAPASTAQTAPTAKISSSPNSLPMPTVTNVPQRSDDDDDEDQDED
jgi:cell division septation protein DedD